MNAQVIETRIAKVWMTDIGIIYSRFADARHITLQDGQETIAAIVRVADGCPRPLIADFTSATLGMVDRSARLSESYPALSAAVSAIAVITKSPVVRFLINLMVRLNSSQTKMMLFANETEAIEWLKGYL